MPSARFFSGEGVSDARVLDDQHRRLVGVVVARNTVTSLRNPDACRTLAAQADSAPCGQTGSAM